MTPLRPEQTREATELLVAAFDEDPFFSFISPDRTDRAAFVGAVMGTHLTLGFPRGALGSVQAPDLRGICIWYAPGDYPIPFAEQLRVRAVAIASAVASGRAKPAVIARAMRAGELFEEALPDEPSFYLQTLAVHPRHHGRGIGSAMLEERCAEADAARRPAVLETSKEMNARLYRRFGFETIRTTIVDGGPPVWTMRRDPRSLS